MIHRDLKPSNILVDDDGEPRVLDFGIARPPETESPDALTLTGEFIGSPAWASPEQVEAEPGRIDVRTDVYSLGVVLYHLLTGTFPYDVSGPIAKVFDAIRHDEPRPPRELVTYIDDELEAVLLQTLAKERERRYASVQEFRDDLERYLLNQPVRAKGEGRWYQFRKLVSRHRALAASLAVAFVLSLGFGVVMLVLYQSQVAATQRAEKAERIATENEQRTAEAQRATQRSLAEAAARAAWLATQRGDWRRALAYFEEAIASGYRDEVEMRLGIVEAHDALNEDEIARNLIAELVRRDDLGDRRGAVLLWQGELELFLPGGRDDAIEFIEGGLREGLDAADEAYARGLLADTVPEALHYFQEALAHDAFHHRAIGMLGVSYLIVGELELARRQFAVTSVLFPDDPATRIAYATTCALQGDRPNAVALIEKTRPQIGDRQTEALLTLIDLLIEMHEFLAGSTPLRGDDTPAQAMFARLLSIYAKLSPTNVAQGELGFDWLSSFQKRLPPAVRGSLEAWMSAIGQMTLGRLDQALHEIERAIAVAPQGAAQLVYGTILHESGRYEEAADAFWKAVEMPAWFDVRHHALMGAMAAEMSFAGFYIKPQPNLSRKDLLLKSIRGVAARDDFEPHLAWVMGGTALAAGEIDLARQVLVAGLRRFPDDFECLRWRARTELAAGAYGPALEFATAADRIRPNHWHVRETIEQARELAGRVGPPDAAVAADEFLLRSAASQPAKSPVP